MTGCLATEAARSHAVLEEVQVDGAGFIFVPYAGRIRAAGNTPERIRQHHHRQAFEDQTPDPQVEVRRVAGDGSTVIARRRTSSAQGVYPIERPTRTLSDDAGKRAGGMTIDARDRAGHRSARQSHPAKSGCKISTRTQNSISRCEAETGFLSRKIPAPSRRWGPPARRARVPFRQPRTCRRLKPLHRSVAFRPRQGRSQRCIFIFRNEPAGEVANQVLGRNDLHRGAAHGLCPGLDANRTACSWRVTSWFVTGTPCYVTEAPITTCGQNRVIASIHRYAYAPSVR